MFESIGRSFKLIGESFRVLEKDKELLLFPFLSGIINILILVLFAIPIILNPYLLSDYSLYVILFLLYLSIYFIATFFSAGLVAAANIRLRGGDPTFSDGIKRAGKKLSKIFVWALVSATVGLIISALRSRKGIGKIVSYFLEGAWDILTFFVVPVLVLEEKGIKDSTKRSLELFKRAWGETVAGQFSISLGSFILLILGFVPAIIALNTGSGFFILLLVLGLIYAVILLIVTSALSGIYKTALYNYASGRKVKFSDEFLKGAFKKQ